MNNVSTFTFSPIGLFRCAQVYPYDAPRQPDYTHPNIGVVELFKTHGFEQALSGLSGFSHLWIIFVFDRNSAWKPMVLPPRGERKVGVFASRSPYRPNSVGLSCVNLERIEGLNLHVSCHDLLDGTPVLDVKPYIPNADAFPEASRGWLETVSDFQVEISSEAQVRLDFLKNSGTVNIEAFIREQLSANPLRSTRKRLFHRGGNGYRIAYRTWRIDFLCNETLEKVRVENIFSGYTAEECLPDTPDPYQDKPLHRLFTERFGI